jgi:hypothetical protein
MRNSRWQRPLLAALSFEGLTQETGGRRHEAGDRVILVIRDVRARSVSCLLSSRLPHDHRGAAAVTVGIVVEVGSVARSVGH